MIQLSLLSNLPGWKRHVKLCTWFLKYQIMYIPWKTMIMGHDKAWSCKWDFSGKTSLRLQPKEVVQTLFRFTSPLKIQRKEVGRLWTKSCHAWVYALLGCLPSFNMHTVGRMFSGDLENWKGILILKVLWNPWHIFLSSLDLKAVTSCKWTLLPSRYSSGHGYVPEL